LSSRVATRGALAVAAAGALALPAAAVAASNGGQAMPAPGSAPAAGDPDPAVTVGLRRAVFVRANVRVRGRAPGGGERSVRIERWSGPGPWEAVATARANPDGSFLARWVPDRPGPVWLRAVVGDSPSAPRPVTAYRVARATWYGPGFYGERTACGAVLRRGTLGLAHRRLPCGAKVAVTYRGRSLVVPVVDRGPYRRGIEYDLTAAAARQLGLRVTSRIGAASLTKSQ
jgi:peptidoglycan lytic transglycosylase